MASIRKIEDGTKFMAARQNYGFVDACPLCKERFRANSVTAIWLIVSNQDGMPNRFVHDECVQECQDAHLPPEEVAIEIVKTDWENAQRYRDWFSSY